MQNHREGLSPRKLQANDALSSFFKILTICSTDENNEVYISTAQAYKYPITCFQWHPEVVVGSFLPNAFKEHKRKLNQDSSTFPPMLPCSGVLGATPLTHATEEYEDAKSTIQGPTSVALQNNVVSITDLNPPSFRSVHWQGLQPSSEQKSSTDINICLQGDQHI